MRLIKRYPNRKLYDIEKSRYINLDEIRELIKEGEEIKVVDSKNNEDLTAITMAQVLLEEGKKNKRIPIQTIKSILMTGSEILSRKITNPVASLKEQAEQKVKKMRFDAIEDIKELITDTQKAYDEVQKAAEERIQFVIKTLSRFTNTHEELNTLKDEIKRLKVRVMKLEKTWKDHESA